MKKKIIIIAITAIYLSAVVVGGYLFVTKFDFFKKAPSGTVIGEVAAKDKIEDFVKRNLGVPQEVEITLLDDTERKGYYEAIMNIEGQKYDMHLSLDGKKFFPTVMDTDVKRETVDSGPEIPKSEKPEVKIFVMSYCPYGTQIEKGILPVLETLGDKIDFSLRFVFYSMHNNKTTGDRKEIDENLRQYCIRTEAPAKLYVYLNCFLEKGKGTENACLKKAGVSVSGNIACMKAADKEFDITRNFNDVSTYQQKIFPLFSIDKAENERHAIQGSPTFVINGVTVDSHRDPASLLKIICSAFENVPDECHKELSTIIPSPGFGAENTNPSTAGSCGN